MRESTPSSMNLTDTRIGATTSIDAGMLSLGPTTTTAITAGRPIRRRITAVCRCAPFSAGFTWLRRIAPGEL
jgi:hypothetical protein